MSFTEWFDNNNFEELLNEFVKVGQQLGMTVTKWQKLVKITRFEPKKTFDGVKQKLRNFPNLQMILFVIPDKSHEFGDEVYSEIKLLGDVEYGRGLTTQCLNTNKIWDDIRRTKKWHPGYLRQLMLKVNPKLGGINVALFDISLMSPMFRQKSVMIVGADVNHPAPADKVSPSIAALVGSYDNEFCNYYTTVRMQPKSREEMIKYLDEMFVEVLNNYHRKQNNYPQIIIFYRDGVSEGQFQHVIDNEYPLLTKAFRKINIRYKPKLTFIVVQKRHHTRFMTADTKVNVSPGTVVEKDITHKHDFDFYLCSHYGRIGTSRSAHYYVLEDENNFSSNDICQMTYHLCHIYQRCTKSVSIPAPVYYADLAAYRAKIHASNQLIESDSGSVERGDEQRIESYKKVIEVLADQKTKLYFS